MMRWTLWFENPGKLFNDSRLSYDWTDQFLPAATPLAANGIVDSTSNCSGSFALATDIGPRLELIACTFCCPEPKMGIAPTILSAPEPRRRFWCRQRRELAIMGHGASQN